MVGYPLAVVVIVRWPAVVREQRARWLAAHHVGVAAIVGGWAVEERWASVGVNATWLVVSTAWYALGGRGTKGA